MKIKYYELDPEEEQILEAYESGKLKMRKPTQNELKKWQSVAETTINKTRNINIRVTERTLWKLKVKAIEEGIPYQTLVGSILHKYVSRA